MLSNSQKVEDKIAFFESLGSPERINVENRNDRSQSKKRKRKDSVCPKNNKRRPRPSAEPQSNALVITKRIFAAKEILSTETTYVVQLQVLLNGFKVPLCKLVHDKKYLSEQEIKIIFSNVESICKFSNTLLDELNPRLKIWEQPNSDQRLGDIFIKMVPFLSLYGEYCTNYSTALKTLIELKKSKPDLTTFIHNKETHTTYKLRDLLILPVQRIMRYRLLLSALLKTTDKVHPDFKELSEALAKVEESNDRVNNQIRQIENQNKMFDLLSRITGEINLEGGLIQPHRRFISEHSLYLMSCVLPKSVEQQTEGHDYFSLSDTDDEGTLQINGNISGRNIHKTEPLFNFIEEKVSEEERKVTCFLFSDIFVVTTPKDFGDMLEWVDYLTLHDSFLKLPFANSKPFSFEYVNPLVTFALRASNVEEKEHFKLQVKNARLQLLSADKNLKKQRQNIKLVENRSTQHWEAYPVPTPYCVRISPKELEEQVCNDTKMELTLLLQNNRMFFESRKAIISKKSLVGGLRGMVSRFSPQKKRRVRPTQKYTVHPIPTGLSKRPLLDSTPLVSPISTFTTTPDKQEVTQRVQLEFEIERWERRLQELSGVTENPLILGNCQKKEVTVLEPLISPKIVRVHRVGTGTRRLAQTRLPPVSEMTTNQKTSSVVSPSKTSLGSPSPKKRDLSEISGPVTKKRRLVEKSTSPEYSEKSQSSPKYSQLVRSNNSGTLNVRQIKETEVCKITLENTTSQARDKFATAHDNDSDNTNGNNTPKMTRTVSEGALSDLTSNNKENEIPFLGSPLRSSPTTSNAFSSRSQNFKRSQTSLSGHVQAVHRHSRDVSCPTRVHPFSALPSPSPTFCGGDVVNSPTSAACLKSVGSPVQCSPSGMVSPRSRLKSPRNYSTGSPGVQSPTSPRFAITEGKSYTALKRKRFSIGVQDLPELKRKIDFLSET